MIIFEKKLIFIHIPKTGGTSVENIISNENDKKPSNLYGLKDNKILQYLSATEVKDLFEDYDRYLKFVIVRNPYDRIISEYYNCNNKNIGFKSKQSFDDFLKYVEGIVNNKKYNYLDNTFNFMPQYKFVYDKDLELIVDNIFYYEKFEEVIFFINKIFNYKKKVSFRENS